MPKGHKFELNREEQRRRKAQLQSEWNRKHKKEHRGYVEKYRSTAKGKLNNREHTQRFRFGKTLSEKVAMWELQDRKCANPQCGVILINPMMTTRKAEDTACWDHDHKCCSGVKTCGKCIRGLLCSHCNRALGLLKEDRYRIQGLVLYLDKHQ